MARVKGTILMDFIKTIRADKSGAYDSYLTEEDKKVCTERILPSGWYPYDTFKNCFNAVVSVLAKGNMEAVRQWGRIYGENIVTGVYKGIVKQGAPLESLKKYSSYVRNLFDFGEIEITPVSEREAIVTIKDFDLGFEPQYYMMIGWMERSLELCGARDISCRFLTKSWENDPQTSFKFTWS